MAGWYPLEVLTGGWMGVAGAGTVREAEEEGTLHGGGEACPYMGLRGGLVKPPLPHLSWHQVPLACHDLSSDNDLMHFDHHYCLDCLLDEL